MARRLMIARAIMHQPEMLFLDEPTTGLDPQSHLAVHDIITGLQAAGQTILLITHDMADALADRVAIIDHGRLLALDTPAGLKRSVRGGTVVTVTADGTGPAQLAAALAAGVPGARDARPLGDAVMLTVDDSQPVLPAVLAAADACPARLREVLVDPPTLESRRGAVRCGNVGSLRAGELPAGSACAEAWFPQPAFGCAHHRAGRDLGWARARRRRRLVRPASGGGICLLATAGYPGCCRPCDDGPASEHGVRRGNVVD